MKPHDTGLPAMQRVRQVFSTRQEADVEEAVTREFNKLELGRTIKAGDSIALTAGSRGIANITTILRAVVEYLRSLGAKPFIVPAMGSHGGGTAPGQIELLASYGIVEDAVNAPIRASMEVVEIGRHQLGGPIYFDRIASQADHVGVIGRIKPHTGFTGTVESGLVKMMMIGLGKHEGAKEYHRVLLKNSWDSFSRGVAGHILQRVPVAFGLAIIENALDQTAIVEGVKPGEFLTREPELLAIARDSMPRLPINEIDLLIIDEIGKEISGSGADTNVIGRKPSADWNERDVRSAGPLVHRIFVRGLSKHTHGNAAGIGLADFTTHRLVKAMDYEATVINCLTANHPLAAAIPIRFRTDREAIEAALKTVGVTDSLEARIAWITNTLQLERIALSTNFGPSDFVNRVEPSGAIDWPFGPDGNLPSLASLFASEAPSR